MFNLLWLSLIKLYNVKNREDEFELKYILDAKSSNSSMYFPARLSHFIIAISQFVNLLNMHESEIFLSRYTWDFAYISINGKIVFCVRTEFISEIHPV